MEHGNNLHAHNFFLEMGSIRNNITTVGNVQSHQKKPKFGYLNN